MGNAVRSCETAEPVISAADCLIARFEEAGATLLALPNRGPSLAMRGFWPPVVHEAIEAYGYTGASLRPATPSAAMISRMDETWSWLNLLPNVAERRIIGARSLVSPVTGRHIFTWRQVARMLGADHRAIQRWHGAAIGRLVVILGAEEKYSRIA